MGTYRRIPLYPSYISFTGIFNGNSYKITNLWIDASGNGYIGFFRAISNAQIRNLGIETAESDSVFGGIAGDSIYSNIVNSYSIGSISGNNSNEVGGIVGCFSNGNIVNSYSIGNVSGSSSGVVGGIVGSLSYGNITNSYSFGSISGGSSGYADYSGWYIGGIVGAVYGNVTIKNNAAINPSVTGIYNVNRVIGAESPYNDGTTTALNNFARSALTSGFTNFADGNEYSGTGKTDGAFLQKSTYETGLGWKFGNGNDNPWVWRAFEDYQYPTLYWQTQKP